MCRTPHTCRCCPQQVQDRHGCRQLICHLAVPAHNSTHKFGGKVDTQAMTGACAGAVNLHDGAFGGVAAESGTRVMLWLAHWLFWVVFRSWWHIYRRNSSAFAFLHGQAQCGPGVLLLLRLRCREPTQRRGGGAESNERLGGRGRHMRGARADGARWGSASCRRGTQLLICTTAALRGLIYTAATWRDARHCTPRPPLDRR